MSCSPGRGEIDARSEQERDGYDTSLETTPKGSSYPRPSVAGFRCGNLGATDPRGVLRSAHHRPLPAPPCGVMHFVLAFVDRLKLATYR